MNDKMYQLLLRSFDAPLSVEEQKMLSVALAESVELRQEKAKLESTGQILAAVEVKEIPYFSGNVMRKINNLSSQAPIWDLDTALSKMFPKVAFASLSLIMLLLTSTYLSEGSLSLEAMIGLTDANTYLLTDSYTDLEF